MLSFVNEPLLEGKPVRESMSEYTHLTQPNDANALGTLFGGRLMQAVDLAGALAAARHARSAVVTASVDQLTFLRPVRIGQLVVLKSAVNRVFHTSMEVGVKVFVEDLGTGESRHVSSAYLTFVALDAGGTRIRIRPVIPETADEKRRYEEARRRREYRRQERKRALERELRPARTGERGS
jgi:acyl-CoA hydrolase